MMNLEDSIKDCIAKELEKGVIEKVIATKLEECIASAVKDLFGWGGDVKKIVEEKVKSVMIPYLESYDYSQYITKLDSVLIDVLKSSTIENKKLLENFAELMTTEKIPKEIKIREIYNKWCDHCKDKIDRDKMDFECGEGYINTTMSVEQISSDWSDYERQMVTFTCEEDEELNIEFMISRWEKYDKNYTLNWGKNTDLHSLKFLSKFDMFMMNIDQAYTKINLDSTYENDEILVECEE